jgi:hypothetical protein
MSNGIRTGSVQLISVLDGVSCANQIATQGTTPGGASTALVAAIAATILSESDGTLTVPTGSLTNGQTLAIFWTVGGVVNACYDVTVASVSTASPNDTVTLTGASSTPTGGQYYAASDSAPTTLPANATAILISVATDVTVGVDIVGANLQQLQISSNQPGLVELFDAVPTERLVAGLPSSSSFYAWPTSLGQSVPFSQTVTKVRFYNNSLNAAQANCLALMA